MSDDKEGYTLTRTSYFFVALMISLSVVIPSTVLAEEPTKEQILEQRMAKYVQFEDVLVPWYLLAAIDQYERNIQSVRHDIPNRDSVTAIQFSEEFWSGVFNPLNQDTSPATINYFGGNGLDGDGDDVVSAQDDEDVMFTMANYLRQFGTSEEDVNLALWEYYKNEKIINQIMTIAKLYKHFNAIDLETHVFPIPSQFNYSYKGTWGASRGWGGRRIHEGTDLFADYGTPVRSTSYGVVEVMGWNEFGGWRIGIRDNHNSYHYYAHLAHNDKDTKIGDVVKPGTIIGYVGSSGYGKEGTSGKFPPHLHYGIYKFDGRNEWAFDPYPSLLRWERQSK